MINASGHDFNLAVTSTPILLDALLKLAGKPVIVTFEAH